MSIKERLSGNEAVAIAIKQINPDVMAAFPITPSTEIPQHVSTFIANGEIDTEFIPVESEHSSMSACIGSQAAGARSMTATSSCGLALMFEMLYIAASLRLPITMPVVNRALSGPININADHSDSMGARDAGWIQMYAENAQEAYDNLIQAVRIGEHKDVLLPVMTCQDGFITSHAVENIEILEDEKVKDFVGEYKAEKFLLHKTDNMSMGPYDTSAYYMEHKYQQAVGMENARKAIEDVAADFAAMSGRKYDYIEKYKMDDADFAIVIIGSSAGTAKDAIDELRHEGVKAGLVKIRVYRPFPEQEIADALSGVKVVGIMDKSEGYSNNGGPMGAEVKAALYGNGRNIKAVKFVYGLGGRDVKIESIREVFDNLIEVEKTGNVPAHYQYIGLRR
ncbi:MAG: pyruvate ferredoxin oxidoreductase [Clostridia bacterium]|jgi:pyruvate ferredoxin oxidoreductase alpha subunit|nr:pyruvate ferredoxin oxidoreductase [Clostridia bacterium]MBT7122994.1 pyruvate ferredoxin oxidoreductase [Clostridia bacterium]